MIFSLIILLLIGVIAFFHYVQGVLSATLSAILAIVAAVLAVSYAEPLVDVFFAGGQFVDYALSVVMVSLFALIYLILRLIFDRLVPGNIRLPVLADRIGAGVMGVIAGLFATGVFALAAEALPFGATIGMYDLYDVATHDAVVRGERNRQYDAIVYDETDVMTLEQTDVRRATWIPVADIVLGMTQRLSAGGSLAGTRELASVHPDWLQELFGQRVGVEPGAKHVAVVNEEFEQVTVEGIYTMDRLPQVSAVPPRAREFRPDELRPGAGEVLMVVRMRFTSDAAGEGGIVRVSTGAVRLRAASGTGASREWVNYFPRGTYESGRLFVNKPSDPIFISGGNGADFLFVVRLNDVFRQGEREGSLVVKPDIFVEAKRLARIDLSGKEVVHGLPPANEKIKVLRTPEVLQAVNQPAQQGG